MTNEGIGFPAVGSTKQSAKNAQHSANQRISSAWGLGIPTSIAHYSAMTVHRVVALLAPPISLFELSCVVEVFGLKRDEIGGDWYELELATTHSGPLGLSATSMQLANVATAAAFANADCAGLSNRCAGRACGFGSRVSGL